MKLTTQAQEEIKKALISFNTPGGGIHLYNTQGCCGPTVQMELSTNTRNNETVVNIDGIDFFIPNDLLPTIADVTVEYSANGFRFNGLKKGSNCCS